MRFAAQLRLSAVIALVVSTVVSTVLSTVGLLGPLAPEALGQTGGPDSPIVIDFDDYPANRVGTPAATAITDFYRRSGLVFLSPVTALVYNNESVPADPGFPRSGSTVITTCYAAEFCTNDIRMALLSPHQRVRLWVGYDGPLSSPAELLMVGFDRDQNRVAIATVAIGPTNGRLPVDIPVEIEDPDGRIATVELRWSDSRSFLSGLSVDDIELTPFVATATAQFDPNPVLLDGRDGPVTQEVMLINTGNVQIGVASVELEMDGSPGSGGEFLLDATACIGRLGRDSSCPITIRFSQDGSGDGAGDRNGDDLLFATMTARTSDGGPVATATVEAMFNVTVDATDQTGDGGEPTGSGEDPGAVSTTSPPTTEEERDLSTEPPVVTPETDITTEMIAALVLVAVILIGWMVRKVSIGRPETPRPEPAPKPEVRVRSESGTHELDGGGRPAVTIRASIDVGNGLTTITDERRPATAGAASGPMTKGNPT